jgi:hypothetical protein
LIIFIAKIILSIVIIATSNFKKASSKYASKKKIQAQNPMTIAQHHKTLKDKMKLI